MTNPTQAEAEPQKRTKGVYVGAPACFALEAACQDINRAFSGFGCYLVGSALERPDWRDIDVRFIMSDEAFRAEFPSAGPIEHARWEFDPKWILLTVSISERLSKLTGLPVDPSSSLRATRTPDTRAVATRWA